MGTPVGILENRSQNVIVNGNFDFWQRGTSMGVADNSYRADRWRVDNTGANTHSRQSSGVPTGSSFYWRTTFAASGAMQMSQSLESAFVNKLKGKTITLSFLIRTSGTFAGNIEVRIQKNATANTSTGGAWSNISTMLVAPTASWVKHNISVTVPDDGTANGLRPNFVTASTQSTGNIVEFSQVQLNIGPAAGPFELAGGNIEGELALCQRYYEKSYQLENFAFSASAGPYGNYPIPVTLTRLPVNIQFKTRKRANPTFLFYGHRGSGGANQLNRYNSDDNLAASIATISSSETNLEGYFDTSPTSMAQSWYMTHWIVDAEL